MNASEGDNIKLQTQDNVKATLHRKCVLDNVKCQNSVDQQLTKLKKRPGSLTLPSSDTPIDPDLKFVNNLKKATKNPTKFGFVFSRFAELTL